MALIGKTIILIFFFISSCIFAQDESETDSVTVQVTKRPRSFSAGLYMGSYFANNYTASLYDGYGYNFDGLRNDFYNSFMYNKIVLQYGGGNGQTNQIAQQLGVDPGQWTFNQSDMPINMRYSPAFMFGLQLRYSVDEVNAILLNINGCKLNINGNFTISTTVTNNTGNQLNNTNLKTFAIKGSEQRLQFQGGYQHIIGEIQKVNGFVEAGLNVTLAKFDRNEILINTLKINLVENYDQPGYNPYYPRKLPIGTGYGVFGGLGININGKVRMQLVYNLLYEGINLGQNTRLKFQHAIALRAYY